MKKSNLILIGTGIALLIFFFAFQLSLHSNIERNEIKVDGDLVASEIRSVSRFKKLNIEKGIKVFLKQDSIISLSITAPKNWLPHIKTQVQDDELIIEKTKHTQNKDSVIVFISMETLNQVNVNSGGGLETVGRVNGSHLELNFEEESKGNLELSYASIKCNLASGSKVKISGNSNEIDISN
ncbi:MAG: DUF2807 domain-containing protein [Bacteroidota bacterium]